MCLSLDCLVIDHVRSKSPAIPCTLNRILLAVVPSASPTHTHTSFSQYNVVINAWAKSGGKGSAQEAEKLLSKMHKRHQSGDPDVRPNVVTYGAVIDAHAKSGERGAAARADALLAAMIQQHQSDPDTFWDLRPNTYVFNTVINCWAKSKEQDAAAKAEEMLVAMGRLHLSGNADLKPDAFTYTAVIDVSGNDSCVCLCVSYETYQSDGPNVGPD